MVLDQYRAVSDYTKSARNELSFKAGDIFEVIEKNDNGAFFGAPPLTTIVCELRRRCLCLHPLPLPLFPRPNDRMVVCHPRL